MHLFSSQGPETYLKLIENGPLTICALGVAGHIYTLITFSKDAEVMAGKSGELFKEIKQCLAVVRSPLNGEEVGPKVGVKVGKNHRQAPLPQPKGEKRSYTHLHILLSSPLTRSGPFSLSL